MSSEPWRYPCSNPGCNRLIDERYETVWRKVSGWEHKRDDGGTNHIALRTPENTFMCDACMTRLRSGVPIEQESLLP